MRFLSEYSGAANSDLAGRQARVFFDSRDGVFGCQFLLNGQIRDVERFTGHSQSYADDAAENYVLGIKQILLTED